MLQKRGLGKGLSAIIPVNDDINEQAVLELDINTVGPGPDQPRKHFDEAALAELSGSIKQYGMLQPLIVTKNNGFYSIVAGERRWRAARMAQLAKVPVIVKEYSEQEVLQVSLIENLQRSDLNLIEEAVGYKKLSDEFGLTQEEIAEKVNKNRSYISNAVRILELDERVREFVRYKSISMGHVKLLMPLDSKDDQYKIAQAVVSEGLSVRDTEVLVKQFMLRQAEGSKTPAAKPAPNRQYTAIENELNSLFGTQVRIISGKKRGKIEIEYYTPDDLDRLIGLFKTKIL